MPKREKWGPGKRRGLAEGAEGTSGEMQMSFRLIEVVLMWVRVAINTHRTVYT